MCVYTHTHTHNVFYILNPVWDVKCFSWHGQWSKGQKPQFGSSEMLKGPFRALPFWMTCKPKMFKTQHFLLNTNLTYLPIGKMLPLNPTICIFFIQFLQWWDFLSIWIWGEKGDLELWLWFRIKKYILGLNPLWGHRAPKTFGISCEERQQGIFCNVNEASLGKGVGTLRSWVPGEPTLGLEGWNFEPYPPDLRGWKGGLETEGSHQWPMI